MLYVLTLEMLLSKWRANLVLCEIMSPGATTLPKYSAYNDYISTLVIDNVKIEEVAKSKLIAISLLVSV